MTYRPWHFRELSPELFDRVKAGKRAELQSNFYSLKNLAAIMSQEGVIAENIVDGVRVETILRDGQMRAEREAADEEYFLRMKLEFEERVRAAKSKPKKRSDESADSDTGGGGSCINPTPG